MLEPPLDRQQALEEDIGPRRLCVFSSRCRLLRSSDRPGHIYGDHPIFSFLLIRDTLVLCGKKNIILKSTQTPTTQEAQFNAP